MLVTPSTVVCISANPALDRRLHLSSLSLGEVSRARSAQALPGGKAAHVAMAARALGARTVWLGFLGGPIGEQCAGELRDLGIEVVPVHTRVTTRVNLELIEDSKRITEILEPGEPPDQRECEEMVRRCAEGLAQCWKGAAVVISGSLPAGQSPDLYVSLIRAARAAGSVVLLDTSGDALQATLAAEPDLVKPNHKEAETLLGQPLPDLRAAANGARKLIGLGAHAAAITLGAEGLVWIEGRDSPAWSARTPRLNAISPVGCGDAALAGFAFAFLQGLTGEKAIRLAAACGAANCLAELPGRISRETVQSLVPRVEVACLSG